MTPCDQCTRGWVPDRDWYKACPVCGGAGTLTAGRVAKLLDLDESTVKGFWNDSKKTRRTTLEKILAKTVDLIEPKRAKQLALGEVLPPQFIPEPANR